MRERERERVCVCVWVCVCVCVCVCVRVSRRLLPAIGCGTCRHKDCLRSVAGPPVIY
jgi:hypothetical protein